MSGRSVPSQLDQVLPRFYVQKAGPYHPFGRIRIAPFGKGGLRILAESGYTHSAEIINEAEHDEVVVISRSKKVGSRVSDIDGLQEALFSIGSAQNIHLARLSRGKKILFLEGDDYRLLKRFAARLDLFDFTNNINITVIPIGGFSQRQRIEDAAWTFQKVLKAEIAIAALLDRDYRCVEEIESLVTAARSTVPNFHILSGKEIENYLLIPSAISRAVMDRFKEGKRSGGEAAASISASDIEQILLNIANEIKSNVLSQYISNRMRFFGQRSSKDPATVAREAIAILDSNWSEASRRFMVIPGKQTLALLNSKLQSALGVSITTSQIVKNITPSEIAPDLHKILHDLNEFAGKS